jgi:LuxR family maltose regulon positive regulatory protein
MADCSKELDGASVSLEPAIAALLNELNRLTGELVIVLDDYHLIELSAIHSSLVYLLEHLPPHI